LKTANFLTVATLTDYLPLVFLIDNKETYKQMSFAYSPYGDGKACERIIEGLFTN